MICLEILDCTSARSRRQNCRRHFKENRENPSTLMRAERSTQRVPVRAVIEASIRCRAIPRAPSIFSDRDICKRRLEMSRIFEGCGGT